MKPFSLNLSNWLAPGPVDLAQEPGDKTDEQTDGADERHGVGQVEQSAIARLSKGQRQEKQDHADEGDPADW